jgi:Ca-activated chloride channel family protein
MAPRMAEPAPTAPDAATATRTPPSLVSVDGRTYPLRSAQVHSLVAGGIAHTTLVQEFENPHDEPLEVLYTMPLPADGAVLGYVIRMGDRVIRGEIEKREVAEETYRNAIYEGRTAGLLEENRADTFTQRLGNLPARTDATVETSVLHPLTFVAGAGSTAGTADPAAGAAASAAAPAAPTPAWEFRFPTVVSTRYQGAPGRVPDSAALDPNRAAAGDIPTRLTIDLRIADAAASAAQSPSHPLSVFHGADAVHVHLAEGAPLDRDLVLRWPAATPDVGVTVTEGPGLAGDTGRYALLTVTPPAVPAATFRRDLTILLDASGSMEGAPIESAKRVAEELLRSLAPGDRFEVSAFSNTTVSLTSGVEDATERAVESCLRKLAKLRAGGGTEMRDAIEAALKSLRPDSQRQIVLLTDGYIGFENEIAEEIRSSGIPGVRIHAVGIGSAPNRTLTQAVSRAGRGVEVLVTDAGEAAAAARRVRAATALPVLTDLTITGDALLGSTPARPRDVFAGQPVVMAVELRPKGGAIDVSGRLAGSKEVWVWRTVIGSAEQLAEAWQGGEAPGAGDAAAAIPIGALYGREHIADLEAGLGSATEGPRLDQAIEAAGLRHRIVSRRTSLVAVAETPSVDPLAPRRRERLAVETPYGVSAEGVGLLYAQGAMTMAIAAPLMRRAEFRGPRSLMKGVFSLGRSDEARGLGEPEAPEAVTITASILEWDGRGLVLEIESPDNRFKLPEGPVRGYLDGAPIGEFEVDRSRSSAKGPHKKGVLVRLALDWPSLGVGAAGREIYLTWDVAKPKSREPSQYAIEVAAPGTPPSGRSA